MKVTRYITAKDKEFVESPVFPSERLGGVHTLRRKEGEAGREGFLGFGVALTGSSCYHLAQMPKEKREAFLQSIYGEGGLGLSVGRVTIGSSDYSPELYSYDDVAGDTVLAHFSVERDLAYIIPMLREILRIKPDLYLFASPWSPPGWMKTGGSIGGGFMRREYVDCYAEYIIRFLKEYERYGIHISALTPQNETETDQGGRMPACIWHPDIEAEFVLALRKRLEEEHMQVKLWICDHNFSLAGRVHWMLDTHTALREACDGVAFHYYSGGIEDTLPLQAAYPALEMHFTEGCPFLDDNYAADWCKWGTMITKALNCGFRSFTVWNLMLDPQGDPNVGPYSCGGFVTRNPETEEIIYSGQYRAFRHFAGEIKRGSVIYPLSQETTSFDVSVFSFPRPLPLPVQTACVGNADGSVTYFLVNAGTKKEQIQIFEGGQWYYLELLPDTLSTVIFQKDGDRSASGLA